MQSLNVCRQPADLERLSVLQKTTVKAVAAAAAALLLAEGAEKKAAAAAEPSQRSPTWWAAAAAVKVRGRKQERLEGGKMRRGDRKEIRVQCAVAGGLSLRHVGDAGVG